MTDTQRPRLAAGTEDQYRRKESLKTHNCSLLRGFSIGRPKCEVANLGFGPCKIKAVKRFTEQQPNFVATEYICDFCHIFE